MLAKPVIFYDGSCGLCHGLVRFVYKHDKTSEFNFSPLLGETFKANVPPESALKFPDSLVLMDKDGRIFLKAFAIRFIFAKLGGVWGFLSALCGVFPWKFKNFIYDLVANVRYKIFGKAIDSCPVMAPGFKERLLP